MRSRSARSVAALGILFTGACSSAGSARSAPFAGELHAPPIAATSRVITSEGIRYSGAHTAWDAIRRLRPNYDLRALSSLPLVPARGAEARAENGLIGLVVDGQRMHDMDVLRAIPADEIVTIQLLNATEAAIFLGTGATRGAIVVKTRASLARR